jgi:hypothetical protein
MARKYKQYVIYQYPHVIYIYHIFLSCVCLKYIIHKNTSKFNHCRSLRNVKHLTMIVCIDVHTKGTRQSQF